MGSGFDVMALLPFILIFGVFYFLILRPQQQKMKKHQAILSNLRRGDRVVTSGGLIGTITKIVSDTEVQLELADDIRVRQVRGLITDVLAKTDPMSPSESNITAPASKQVASSRAKKSLSAPANRSKGKA
jgi:preprotein translocase subunit YajC